MVPVVAIGSQDFAYIRENDYFYVDKTDFIREWWESGDVVTLITRPRRFGKTLNMSMLERFFSNQYPEQNCIFEGLSIWKGKKYRELQGTWPVIYLSLAGVKRTNFADVREGMIQTIIDLYAKHRFLLEIKENTPGMEGELNQQEREYFDYIEPGMSDTVAAMALHRLAICMHRCYGKKVIILLDEYDTPLHEAYVYGFWEQLMPFISKLFNCTFKTNPYMERGLLTGITRVSKESIFSDMNNLEVVMTTSEKYESAFGFTETEVSDALQLFGLYDQLENVRHWYDGFCFGRRRDIYNPWSITKYLDTRRFGSYWANTSSNRLVGTLLKEGSAELKMAAEDLLADKTICTCLDEEIAFDQLNESDDAVWSLLLATGYLKVNEVTEPSGEKDATYILSLTNLEVKREFRKIISKWFKTSTSRYNDFIRALLVRDVDYMNQYMNQIALQTFHSFDTEKQPSEQKESLAMLNCPSDNGSACVLDSLRESGHIPERFYHGFVLGLIVELADQYRIWSNRESGFGRYDVVLEPVRKGMNAYVLEFKVYNPAKEESLSETVKEALAQIDRMKYDTDLLSRGISKDKIFHYGFAFEGKKVLIG